MGGSSKKVTVGYKYYLGMHMVLCHGPIDRITRIEVGEKPAWEGSSEGGRITINNPNLFGGEKREGGISGAVDIDMGGPSQGQNSYLAARLGSNLPAFRGVVSAVLRQVYLGMNPYLKAWSFRAQRIHKRSSGLVQWYDEKAAINQSYVNYDGSIWKYKVVDDSGIADRPEYAAPGYDDSSWEEGPGGFGHIPSAGLNIGTSIQPKAGRAIWLRKKVYVSNSYGITKLFVDVYHDDWGTLWWNGHQIPVPNTQGEFLSVAEIPGNLIQYENTVVLQIVDSVPYGTPTNILAGVTVRGEGSADMNPAHIIRECLTDKVWGMGYPETDLEEQTFIDSADRLYAESLGLSLLWDRQIPLEEFVQEVLKHIDGVLRVNRRTGKFELKLVRDDYELDDLLELHPGNVQKVEGFSRPSFGELVNSVSVNYWDSFTGEPASLSVQDIALIATQGTTINTTVQYPGVTNQNIASRLAARDLKTLSSPLISCTLYTNQDAKDLNVGDVFKLTWPDYMVEDMPMRVTSIAYGNGRSNRVKIQAAQDIFGLPESIMPNEQGEGWMDPVRPPVAADNRLLTEATYFDLLLQMGHTQLTQELADVPELGYFLTTAGRSDEAAINMQMRVDSGAGYEDVGVIDFCPTGKLDAPLGKFVDTFVLTDVTDGDLIEVGSRAYIGEELVAVSSWDPETGDMTVIRGILDTVPVEHPAGSVLYFAELYLDGDGVEYVDGDVVNIKLLPVTGEGVLDENSIQPDTIELDARAIRPFRPANLRAFGELEPDPNTYPAYPVSITWNERNRLQETTDSYLSWTDASVTPESGTDYRVLVEAIQEDGTLDGVPVDTFVSGTSYQLTEAAIGTQYAGSPFMRVTVWARRDGYLSWQAPSVAFRGPFREPDLYFAVYRAPQPPTGLSFEVI